MRPQGVQEMRRLSHELVADLRLPVPAEPEHLVSALCQRMGLMLGVPVEHHLVAFPDPKVTGVWVDAGDTHYVLCEKRTTPWHQIVILGHEFYHMLTRDQLQLHVIDDVIADDHDERAKCGGEPAMLLPGLTSDRFARIVAARSDCHGPAEEDADLFAIVFHSIVTRWARTVAWNVSPGAERTIERLEAAFGNHGHRHV